MKNEMKYQALNDTNKMLYQQLVYAEAKHGVLIGILGVIIIAFINLIVDSFIREDENKALAITLIVLSVGLFISLLVSLYSFIPITSKIGKSEKVNIFYFNDLKLIKSSKSYIDEMRQEDELLEDLANQNIILSKILSRKYKIFSIAINLMFATLCLPIYIIIKLSQLIIAKFRRNK